MIEVHGYSDASHSVIEVTIDGTRKSVPDDPSNADRQLIAEWEADGNTIPPYVAPPPPPYSLQVAMIWVRMSDEEAETFDAAMASASPLRMRKAFNAATAMQSDGELFAFTKNVVKTALGASRANEIMAEPAGDEMFAMMATA